MENVRGGGGGQPAGIFFQGMHQQPVPMNRGMPVVAAVKRRMQAAREMQVRGVADRMLRLIRELALDARESERCEGIEDRGVAQTVLASNIAHAVLATAAAPASASQPDQWPTASSCGSTALQAPFFLNSAAMQRCSASCASPSAAAVK